MLALLLILIGYSLKTGYFSQTLTFLFQPNFHALNARAILDALGHAFFTLSLASGSIIMYGAYLPENTSIPGAAVLIAIADTFIALVAGLAIFPIVFANDLAPSAGPGLIFQTLPITFSHMPFGQLFAVLFFIILVFAAFTSAISLLEPTVAWLMENFRMRRHQAALISGAGLWVLGLGTIFSFNLTAHIKFFSMNFFELMDYLTANIMLPSGGLLIAVFASWQMKKQASLDELNLREETLFHSWQLCLKYLSPIAIGVVFLNLSGLVKF